MNKDFQNVVEINDGNIGLAKEALDDGKTVLLSVEKGEFVRISLEKGYSDYYRAQIELKETDGDFGTCGCGKPADSRVYLWRE